MDRLLFWRNSRFTTNLGSFPFDNSPGPLDNFGTFFTDLEALAWLFGTFFNRKVPLAELLKKLDMLLRHLVSPIDLLKNVQNAQDSVIKDFSIAIFNILVVQVVFFEVTFLSVLLI
jgi:hypothetical protein